MPVNRVEIEVGEKLFTFLSLADWIQNGRFRFRDAGRSPDDTVCVAADGLLVMTGKGFREAGDRNAYPVSVFAVDF